MALDIQPGDILLHKGRGEISKLIMWVGESIYSHSAFVYDASHIIESASKGVNKSDLNIRITKGPEWFYLIDVYRPTKLAHAPTGSNYLDAIRESADSYEGSKFPVNKLFEFGIICAIRNKVAPNVAFRLLVWRALKYVLRDEKPPRLMCSEFVYRCFTEAATAPPRALAPTIIVTKPAPEPFPDVDWAKLWQEYEEAVGPAVHDILDADFPESDVSSDERFEMLRQRVLVRLFGLPRAFIQADKVIPNPPPRSILPADLAHSPSHAVGDRIFDKP
jgi:hypothetical protein